MKQKIFISTGEVSGDLHGSLLATAIFNEAERRSIDIEILGLGGEKMKKAGVKIFLNYAELDIGQSLIFQNGHCLGLETITGTDEMIRAIINFIKRNNNRSKEILS